MKKTKLTRAQFLRTIGMTPFGFLLPNMEAFAQGSNGKPKRLILLYSPNGTVWDGWKPQSNGTFNKILEPMQKYRQKMSIVDGLSLQRPPTITGGHHVWGMATLWTGANQTSQGWTTGPSIDQIIGKRISANSAYTAINLGVSTGQLQDVRAKMTHEGSNQPITPDDDPSKIFSRLFGGSNLRLTGYALAGASDKSVLDHTKGQIDFLKSKRNWFSGADMKLLDAHLQAIRELERREEIKNNPGGATGGGGNPTANINCQKPAAVTSSRDIPQNMKTNLDLMVQALGCGLTNVATFQFGTALSMMTFPFVDGVPGNEGHHALSHGNFTDFNNKLIKVNNWIAQQFAYMMEKLDSTSEPGGNGSMLDNTLIVWSSELGDGNGRHSTSPVPFMLAGGGLKQPGKDFAVRSSHTSLLKSICHTFGLTDVAQVGDVVSGQSLLSDILNT